MVSAPPGFRPSSYKKAKILKLNGNIDEDVTLLIEGAIINCFISSCPYEIQVGDTYDVELVINLADDLKIERVEPRKILIERMDHGYSYLLYGNLRNDIFLSFTALNAEGIHYDHPECNDQFIKLEVERIDVSFH